MANYLIAHFVSPGPRYVALIVRLKLTRYTLSARIWLACLMIRSSLLLAKLYIVLMPEQHR